MGGEGGGVRFKFRPKPYLYQDEQMKKGVSPKLLVFGSALKGLQIDSEYKEKTGLGRCGGT